MFLELDVEVSFSFDSSSTTGFEFNSLRARLLTVLRVVYAIVRLSWESTPASGSMEQTEANLSYNLLVTLHFL